MFLMLHQLPQNIPEYGKTQPETVLNVNPKFASHNDLHKMDDTLGQITSFKMHPMDQSRRHKTPF